MLALLDHGVAEGFIRPDSLKLLVVSTDPDTIVGDLMIRAPASDPRQSVDFEQG